MWCFFCCKQKTAYDMRISDWISDVCSSDLQQADARRQRLQEPDVRDRRGELDMAHALAAYFRDRDFDTAFLADDALVFHALILAAQAFIILDRTKDARAEQAVTFGLERAVVDGFGLLDLAERPRANTLRAREDRKST